MFIIRREQMEVFKQYMLNQFVQDAADHLRQLFPDQTSSMEDSELTAFVGRGINQAKKYGIIDKDNVLRYLECMMSYKENFDISEETRWASTILCREELSATVKMDLIDWHELHN